MNQKPHPFTRLTKTKRRAARHDQRAVELTRRMTRRQRRRCLRQIGLPFLVAAIVGLISWQAWTHVGGPDTRSSADRPLSAPGELPGLQDAQAPWPLESANLASRYQALGFPPSGDGSYHIHVLLHVYVAGQPVPVPANMGISAVDQVESPLHTHPNGNPEVLHIEAGREFSFRLSDVFALWGVVFTNQQLGGYINGGQESVQTYVNGQLVADPIHYVLKRHDNIVVAYGALGSFPTEPPADALNGI